MSSYFTEEWSAFTLLCIIIIIEVFLDFVVQKKKKQKTWQLASREEAAADDPPHATCNMQHAAQAAGVQHATYNITIPDYCGACAFFLVPDIF